MQRIVLFTASALTVVSLIFLCALQQARASTEFMDGKLIINGFVKETMFYKTQMYDRDEEWHDNKMDYAVTSALFEALYTVKEQGDLSVKLFGGLKWWWAKETLYDDKRLCDLSQQSKRSAATGVVASMR